MSTEGISELLVDVSNGHVALNDAGTIAFVGVALGGNHALYVSTRTGWSKAFTQVGVMLTDPSINDTGEISILAYTDAEEGIDLLKKDTIAPVVVVPGQNGFVGLANENDLNERGQIVYRAEPPDTIVLVDRGQHRVVALNAGQQFSLNNSGHVAVAGDAGVTQFSPLRGTSQQISSNPTYTVSLADSGDVAFSDGFALMFSQKAIGSSVVRTAVPVVKVGDVVDGVQVISIDMHRRSLNSKGEIVFVVALSNGRYSVMLARPSHP
jgi:hypothetical protein